ncbi:hypothetical protein GCM10023328_06130 [Modestobacter marinus]|uniref:Uncharacterized protein n=1 Tax=Modestobacter marinus TaxID=477641 RepID=A0A846LNG4_9ACTN|nr:hypothetical protein [Modestobacter marinus]NIH66965.1 hypothetical protein [Modestobacter marinus]GGL50753.1 hypothetical protein GCM10011589_03830 [Modestobacter marinus]
MSRWWSSARRLLAAELRSYRTLPRWVLRRPDAPPGTVPFRYVGAVLPVLWAFIVVSSIEVVVVHVLVPWPTVRLVLDVLGIWGVLWMLGFTASQTVRPHLLDATGLRVRHGVSLDVFVPWEAVAAVAVHRRSREGSRAVQLDEGPDGVVLNVVVGSQTTVDVVLREPLVLPLPAGPQRVTAVRLAADDPAGLAARARAALAA